MSRQLDEPVFLLSIGSVLGGRTDDNRAWSEEIASLTRDVAAARAGLEGSLRLNVVFHVAGNLLQPDFEGVRTSTFSRPKRLLMIQVALTEGAPPDPRRALLDLLRQAVLEAESWSIRRKVPFEIEPLRRILDSVTR